MLTLLRGSVVLESSVSGDAVEEIRESLVEATLKRLV